MKKILFGVSLLLGGTLFAQDQIQDILRAGFEDATHFSKDYIAPVSDAAIYSMANGWYNSGKTKDLFHFEISIISNLSIVPDDKQNFTLNTNDYNYIQFPDGSTSKQVASILGHNNSDQVVQVEYQTEKGTETASIVLPQGLGDDNVNFVPTAYLQGSLGLIKGFEIKLRYFPEIDYDGAKTKFYGAALQHEFTSWLAGEDVFPVGISALIGYNRLEGSYDLESTQMSATGQQIDTEMNSWIFTAIVSTNLPVINFYGGLGYVNGDSTTRLKGVYTIDGGPLAGQTISNPYSVSSDVGGVNATLGTKLKLGFFRINASYSFQEYQNINLGINFGY